MGNLHQQAHAVAHLAGGVLARPVLQALHNGQGVVNDAMAGNAVDAHHRTDAAGIVLKALRIQGVILVAVFHEKTSVFFVRMRNADTS